MSAAALVLQGPILSKGYDSNDNISRIIQDFGSLFDTIVITTWKGTGLRRQAWRHPKVLVVEADDVGTGVDLNGVPVGNRWRHMMGTGFGLDELKASGFQDGYVIKQRSDQYLDLRMMLEHMRRNDALYQDYREVGQNGFLYFLALFRNNPYIVNDFVFAGHLQDIRHLVDASLQHRNLIFRETASFPEGDFIQKYLYTYLRPHFSFADYRYFPRIQKYHTAHLVRKYPAQILELWGEVLRTSICAFPREVAKTTLRRSRPWYPDALERNRFVMYFEEWGQVRLNIKASVTNDLSAIFDVDTQREDRAFFYLDERALQVRTGKKHSALALQRKIYRQFISCSKKCVFDGPEYVAPWRQRLGRFKSMFNL